MWPSGKISKHSQLTFNAFISKAKHIAPAPQKKQADDEISIHVVDQILAYNFFSLILQQ
jgi:hypothetical protein